MKQTYKSLLLMMSLGKTSFNTKAKILFAILGGGAVVAVAMKNVQKDKELQKIKSEKNG
jgi:hypothetical protein